ncbi:MAG TPA: hypothetical protein VGQ83_18915 [Polyangia bacterium]|jgi:hypothetical protein
MRNVLAVTALMALALGGCVKEQVIPYTRVLDTPQNRELVQVVERYRMAMERKDAVALLSMASPDYFEDSGTPGADDDYGYDGLRAVLQRRLSQIETLRYSMQYMHIEVKNASCGSRMDPNQKKPCMLALVDVYIDGSFQIRTPQGDRWDRKQDPHRFELVHDGQRWLFRRGM